MKTDTLNTNTNCTKTIKFLYSYGGKIVPRRSDGLLRYVGGYTRVLSVDRSVTFSELMVKYRESCGFSINLRCKLPNEDLDLLVAIKSDEDLRNVIEEYDKASPEMKIRAVLFPVESAKKVSPPSSPMSCFDFPSAPKPQMKTTAVSAFCCVAPRCGAVYHGCLPAVGYPVTAGKYRCCEGRSSRHLNHVPRRKYTHSH